MDRPLLAGFWLIFRVVFCSYLAYLSWSLLTASHLYGGLFCLAASAFFWVDTIMGWREITRTRF